MDMSDCFVLALFAFSRDKRGTLVSLFYPIGVVPVVCLAWRFGFYDEARWTT